MKKQKPRWLKLKMHEKYIKYTMFYHMMFVTSVPSVQERN